MLNFVLYILLLYLALCTVYLLVLTFLACFFRKRQGSLGNVLPQIAVVIPAHNESTGICDSLRAIKQSDYPTDRIQVFVVADNCTDNTAELATKEGAVAVVRNSPNEAGKGNALDWFFKTQQALYHFCDIVVLIDADTAPDRRFFMEIASSFAAPEVDIVQGYYSVSNPKDNWMTALSLAALSIAHHLRPAGREMLKGTASLKGNGMAFRKSFFLQFGWPCHSIVEDLEFSLYLLEKGYRVNYNPDAIVYGEMPVERKQAEPQRRRWEEGRFLLAKRWVPRLGLHWLTRWQFAYFDAIMDLCILPLSLLLTIGLVLEAWAFFLQPQFLSFVSLLLTGLASYVIIGLALKKPPAYVWLALLAAPFFIFFKLLLYTKMLFSRKSSRWTRTVRNSERH